MKLISADIVSVWNGSTFIVCEVVNPNCKEDENRTVKLKYLHGVTCFKSELDVSIKEIGTVELFDKNLIEKVIGKAY